MEENVLKHIEKHIKSFKPVVKEYWWIKFSHYKGNILLFCGSVLTGQVITQYFSEEDDAVMYINWLFHQNPAEYFYPKMPKHYLTKKKN